MNRDEDDIEWIISQRKKLDQERFLQRVGTAIREFRQSVDWDEPLSNQDFTSQTFVEFAAVLEPFFPGLAPQDLYRFKSVRCLIDRYGVRAQTDQPAAPEGGKNQVERLCEKEMP
jgi:hypothetical protein